MPASRGDDGGEFGQDPAGAQFVGVVHDRFQPQHVFAFGVGLQRQPPEMDFEQRQAVTRCLDQCCQRGRPGGPVVVRAGFRAEQRAQRGHVQPGPGPVHHPVEDALHLHPRPEQQVPAVFGLVDRVAIGEAAALLLGEVQPETQAGRVDPPVADLAQAPYSRR
jgi:hypothetical protein